MNPPSTTMRSWPGCKPMDSYSLKWKPSAERELRKLPRPIIARLVAMAEALRGNPYPPGAIKMANNPTCVANSRRRLSDGLRRAECHADRGNHPCWTPSRGVPLNLVGPDNYILWLPRETSLRLELHENEVRQLPTRPQGKDSQRPGAGTVPATAASARTGWLE